MREARPTCFELLLRLFGFTTLILLSVAMMGVL